jgi:hypothetical protein
MVLMKWETDKMSDQHNLILECPIVEISKIGIIKCINLFPKSIFLKGSEFMIVKNIDKLDSRKCRNIARM